MSEYNRNWRFPSDRGYPGFAYMPNVCPPRFVPNYLPGQRYSVPPQNGPSRWPRPYPMPYNRDKNQQPASPANCQFSPATLKQSRYWGPFDGNTQPASPASTIKSNASGGSSPRRPKGPRTPPGPPPEDQPTIESYLSPTKDVPHFSTYDYDKNSNNGYHWQQERSQKPYRMPIRHRYKNEMRGRGRRNSLPTVEARNFSASLYRNNDRNVHCTSTENHLSDSELDQQSEVVNNEAQSYLLQMLKTVPPPRVLNSSCPLPPLSSNCQPIFPQAVQIPPPLPPTPTEPLVPPPPPSDEENWDTPSEASNDATAYKSNSPRQAEHSNPVRNKLASDEENWDTPSEASNDATTAQPLIASSADTISIVNDPDNLSGALVTDFRNANFSANVDEIDNRDHMPSTVENIPNDATASDANDGVVENENAARAFRLDSFKIKLPSRANLSEQQQTSADGSGKADEPLLNNDRKALGSELTIDIPSLEDITDASANQGGNNLENLQSILKIFTPNITDSVREKNNEHEQIKDPHPTEQPHTQENNAVKDSTNQKVSKTKSKRKKNSSKSTSKSWPLELAEQALRVEQEILKESSKENVLVLRFPDPPLSRETVKGFCKDIESVHFQHNSAPRYCFASIRNGVDVESVISTISKIKFGTGTIKAELRSNMSPNKGGTVKADNIDPFTLYVGNLSASIPCKLLKEHFPGASRINIGFAQRMKFTRYAFVQYQKVEDAIEAYKRMVKSEIEGRSLVIRFKRLGSAATNEEANMHEGDVNDLSCEQADTCSVTSCLTMPSDITEETTITAENVFNESDTLSEAIGGVLNENNDMCEHQNEPTMEVESEVTVSGNCVEVSNENTSIANKDRLEEGGNENELEVHGENDKEDQMMNSGCSKVAPNTSGPNQSSNAEEIEHANTNIIRQSNESAHREENTNLSPEISEVLLKNVANPKESSTLESSTQTETEPYALGVNENDNNDSRNSETVQSLMLESMLVQTDDTNSSGPVKTEATERVVYSMPRSNQCLETHNSLVNVVSKTEVNEDFEFFSDRASGRTSVFTERPPSATSHISSADISNSGDQRLNRMESLSTAQHLEGNLQMTEEFSPDIVEDIDKDISLLQQSLSESAERTNQNLEPHQQADVADKAAPRTHLSRTRKATMPKTTNTCSDNDQHDLVPPSALLLRRDSRLMSNDTSSTVTYRRDDTQLQIKTELTDSDNSKKERKQVPHNYTEKRKATTAANITDALSSLLGKRKSSTSARELMDIKPMARRLPNVHDNEEDDDLVPENCALYKYKKPVTLLDLTLDDDPILEIKREAETEDLFSLPKRTNRGERSRPEVKNSNARTCEDKKERNKEVRTTNNVIAKSVTADDDDDDVIIVSHNLSTQPLQTIPLSPGLRYLRQKDTFKIKHESNSPTSIEKSFFGRYKRPSQHGDNLDRLFALLNSNSDEES